MTILNFFQKNYQIMGYTRYSNFSKLLDGFIEKQPRRFLDSAV